MDIFHKNLSNLEGHLLHSGMFLWTLKLFSLSALSLQEVQVNFFAPVQLNYLSLHILQWCLDYHYHYESLFFYHYILFMLCNSCLHFIF